MLNLWVDKKDPLKSDFAMVDQLRRATISISDNIAEGFERETDKEVITISKQLANYIKHVKKRML